MPVHPNTLRPTRSFGQSFGIGEGRPLRRRLAARPWTWVSPRVSPPSESFIPPSHHPPELQCLLLCSGGPVQNVCVRRRTDSPLLASKAESAREGRKETDGLRGWRGHRAVPKGKLFKEGAYGSGWVSWVGRLRHPTLKRHTGASESDQCNRRLWSSNHLIRPRDPSFTRLPPLRTQVLCSRGITLSVYPSRHLEIKSSSPAALMG